MLCSLERSTGLALFITKAIVEAHNSRINAENNRASGGKLAASFPANHLGSIRYQRYA
jgi:K+-sensing histidine kinase KdpD